jgi:hypothetical protein
MPTIGKNSCVTRVENNKQLVGVVVDIYTRTIDGCKPQTIYNVLWNSYLYPVPYIKSDIKHKVFRECKHLPDENKQDSQRNAEIVRLHDASVVREQCVRIMKKNPVFYDILNTSERGIKLKNEDRIIKNRQLKTVEYQYPTTFDDKENLKMEEDERIKPVWKDSILTCHYYTHDCPVVTDFSTCSPFKIL